MSLSSPIASSSRGGACPIMRAQSEQIAYHMAGIMYGDFRVALRVPPGIDPTAT